MYADIKRQGEAQTEDSVLVRRLKAARDMIAARPDGADRPCFVTAVARAVDHKYFPFELLSFVRRATGTNSIAYWHDTHTREECVAVMDRAIELARAA